MDSPDHPFVTPEPLAPCTTLAETKGYLESANRLYTNAAGDEAAVPKFALMRAAPLAIHKLRALVA